MKKTIHSAILGTLVLVAISGCEQEKSSAKSLPTPSSSTSPATASTSSAKPSAGTHTHDDGSTHAAHDAPATSSASAHGGTISALGEKEVAGFVVTAKQEGEVVAGSEAVFLIETKPASDTVRLWIGDEAATNTTKAKAEGGPTEYHAHASVPSPLAADAQLWVEVQNAKDERGAVAFDLKGSTASLGAHSHGGETHQHEGEAGHSHAPAPTPAAGSHTHGDGSSHSH